jgi:hypothetical protein
MLVVVGAQLEVNWLHKHADSPTVPGFEATLDYLQVPILLRLHSPSRSAAGFQLYGIVGPTFDFKMRESLAGLNVSGIDDAFENFDVGAIAGSGLAFGTVIAEGRYCTHSDCERRRSWATQLWSVVSWAPGSAWFLSSSSGAWLGGLPASS